jgi:class 3 adenylate cyclase
MRAGIDAPVRKALDDAVARWAPASSITQTEGGDSALVVTDDPVALVQSARHLIDDVYKVPGQPRLRVALHYGEVRTYQRETDLVTVIAGGDAILCASRVEPLVEPGQIWATEAFREQFLQRPSLWRTTPVPGPAGSEVFNISKTGTGEPDTWVRLYRLES